MAFRADRKNPKASMMATFGHYADSRQRVVDQVRHELMGFGDPHTSVPWGDELIAIAEELTTAYGDEYVGEDWQVAMDRFCSDAAFGASTLMCAGEQARVAPESSAPSRHSLIPLALGHRLVGVWMGVLHALGRHL